MGKCQGRTRTQNGKKDFPLGVFAGHSRPGQMNCERGKVGKLPDVAEYAGGVAIQRLSFSGFACLFVIAFKANKRNYLLHFAALDKRTNRQSFPSWMYRNP